MIYFGYMGKKNMKQKPFELPKCPYCGKPAPSKATKALHILRHANLLEEFVHQALKFYYDEGAVVHVSPKREWLNACVYFVGMGKNKLDFKLKEENEN